MYQLSNRQMSSQVGNETVILDHADGIYFGLENVGTTVWNKLQEGPQDLQTLVAKVCETFDIETNACEVDVLDFLDDLIKQKLVVVTA
jgi:Coenzyme PQQ synthesis protein D (PqqD)